MGINKDYLRDVIDIDDHVVSTGLNLIVGKRGTGKTHFLKTIKKIIIQKIYMKYLNLKLLNQKII